MVCWFTSMVSRRNDCSACGLPLESLVPSEAEADGALVAEAGIEDAGGSCCAAIDWFLIKFERFARPIQHGWFERLIPIAIHIARRHADHVVSRDHGETGDVIYSKPGIKGL